MTMLSDGMLMGVGGYTYEETQSLPAMTSNTAPAGHVATGSAVSGGYAYYRALDQINAASGDSWVTPSATGWVQRQTPSAIVVWKYRIRIATGLPGNAAPRDWTLQGSNDGSSWTNLDTISGQTGWSPPVVREFVVPSPQSFSYHRLNVTANNGNASLAVSELELLQRFG